MLFINHLKPKTYEKDLNTIHTVRIIINHTCILAIETISVVKPYPRYQYRLPCKGCKDKSIKNEQCQPMDCNRRESY